MYQLNLRKVKQSLLLGRIGEFFKSIILFLFKFTRHSSQILRCLDEKNVWNLKKLPTPFHSNHPAYNNYIMNEINLLKQSGNLNLNSMQNLQHNMRLMIGDAYRSGGTLNQYFKF